MSAFSTKYEDFNARPADAQVSDRSSGTDLFHGFTGCLNLGDEAKSCIRIQATQDSGNVLASLAERIATAHQRVVVQARLS